MKIGIDARFFGGEQSKGLGRYTQQLISTLASMDAENEYVVFLQRDEFRQWNIEQRNIRPVLAPYRWYTLAEQLFMPVTIRRQGVDLMHFPHFNVPLLYRKPFIATIHDLIIIHFPTERATTLGPLLYKFKHWAGKLVMRHAVLKSTHIITVSKFSKEDIARYYGIPGSKITVTYEAAELHPEQGTRRNDEELLSKYSVRRPFFLYVGNAYPHKNLEILLDVAKALKSTESGIPWTFVLVGKKDYFYARLKQEAWSRDLDDLFVFPGFVPDRDLPAFYRNARAYIFPSRYEGFGLPPLEAMSYGTPVLASRASCLPEVLGDAALYFHPEDVSGIINAIQTVDEDDKLRERLIEKGRRQVQKYSWQRMAEATLQLYNHVGSQIKKTSS